jgi:hypothetical protein
MTTGLLLIVLFTSAETLVAERLTREKGNFQLPTPKAMVGSHSLGVGNWEFSPARNQVELPQPSLAGAIERPHVIELEDRKSESVHA